MVSQELGITLDCLLETKNTHGTRNARKGNIMFKDYTIEMYREDEERFNKDSIINTYVNKYVKNVKAGNERLESPKGGTTKEEIIMVNYYRKVINIYSSLLDSFDDIPHESDVDWLLKEGLLNEEQHLHLDCYTTNKH